MLTEFGKRLREIRIHRGLLLKNMADDLNITSSYLSAIEHGKKAIPSDLISRLANIYGLDDSSKNALQIAQSMSKKDIRIPLKDCTQPYVDLADSFVSRFKNLSIEQIKQIKKILKDE